jgi:hypothetical protein
VASNHCGSPVHAALYSATVFSSVSASTPICRASDAMSSARTGGTSERIARW